MKIVKVNWKHNLGHHVGIALVLCLISPLLMGVNNLDQYQTAQVVELYISLIGIILCVPLFLPDQNKDIRDLIESKKEKMYIIHIIRIVEACFFLCVLIGGYLYFLQKRNCVFDYNKYYFATLANSLFLGGIGTLTYSIANNIIVAYMLPILYYILCFGTGSQYLGDFFLFSMMHGGFKEKYYLFTSGIFMIIISIIFRHMYKRILLIIH